MLINFETWEIERLENAWVPNELDNVAVANALQLEAARVTYASYFPLYYDRRHVKFEVDEPIYCRIVAFLMLIHYFTMWSCDIHLWHLTLNICSVSLVTWLNSEPNLNTIEQPRRSYCDFSVWPYDLEHCIRVALRVALGFGIIFTKFDLRQLLSVPEL